MSDSNAAVAVTSNADQFELNKGDNFIFGMDVSASMQTTDCPNGASRIDYLKETAKTFAREASKWDTDGIDVLTFGSSVKAYPNITADNAEDIIGKLVAKEGSTDTAGLIKKAYEMHKAGAYPQTVLFICTDGVPNDKQAVEKTIIDITNEIKDEHEFAISILKVGTEPTVDAWLKELDDNLTSKGAKYDIVDVKNLDEVDFMAAFEGALHD